MKLIALVAAVILIIATAVFADCTYNGLQYPTGTNINGVICQPDGTWR